MDSAAVSRKRELRRTLLAARRAVPVPVREAEARALAAVVLPQSGTVCAYHPVGAEPGSGTLLDALLARGHRVLLPVVAADGRLDWAVYTGALRAGPFGLLEPDGALLGPGAIVEAALVLVPALAVDAAGVRLGRGGGYYDRSLPLAGDVPLVAVVRDDELVDELPAEPHDVRMTGVLTPGRGLLPLRR